MAAVRLIFLSLQIVANASPGAKQVLRQVGPGLVTQETVACSNCSGSGQVIPEKQRCKKCKGKKVVESKNVLELYIPRGARQGGLRLWATRGLRHGSQLGAAGGERELGHGRRVPGGHVLARAPGGRAQGPWHRLDPRDAVAHRGQLQPLLA